MRPNDAVWSLSTLFAQAYLSKKLRIITVLFLVMLLRYMWATKWQNQQNKCAPSKDSDQPGHLPSLIRVFAVRMKKAWVLSYPLSAQQRLWSDCANAQVIWVFAGLTLILLVLSCCSSCCEPWSNSSPFKFSRARKGLDVLSLKSFLFYFFFFSH